ncbi:hypothetical protein LguiA_022759 [Lonicera macranthoides]
MSSTAGKTSSGATPGHLASAYNKVQISRLKVSLPLLSVLPNSFKVVKGLKRSAVGNPALDKSCAWRCKGDTKLGFEDWGCAFRRTGPGGHNVICEIFDYLQDQTKGSTMYGFKEGPARIMNCKYVELTTNFVYPYRNQFKKAEEIAVKLDLDGLVVIGGDDSNTNACLLAENFRGKKLKTRVIGCPKTINSDLKSKKFLQVLDLILHASFEATTLLVHCHWHNATMDSTVIVRVQQLIAELNEILAHDVVDKEEHWKKKLKSQSH